MLSRRLIRIKVFKTLFAFVGSESDNVNAAQKTLLESCDKVRDLYYFMLNISGPLVRVAEEKIAAGLRKFHPTEAEANPNLLNVGNGYAKVYPKVYGGHNTYQLIEYHEYGLGGIESY